MEGLKGLGSRVVCRGLQYFLDVFISIMKMMLTMPAVAEVSASVIHL